MCVFHFCSVGELTGVSDALQWPCVVVPCRTFSLLDGVVFLLDLSQVGPHADERLMDRVLCFVPALLSSCSPAFFPFFFFSVFLSPRPPLFFLVFGTFWRCFLGVSIAHLRIVVGSLGIRQRVWSSDYAIAPFVDSAASVVTPLCLDCFQPEVFRLRVVT